MRVIIPMAGDGKRFLEAGYKINKAVLPMIYRKDGRHCPMTVCSVRDLPGILNDGSNIAFIMRDFHVKMGLDTEIRKWYPHASFYSVKEVTEGQACTCLLARDFIDNDELLIAACDNGIEYDSTKFEKLKEKSDVIVFTYRHNARVRENPDAFGWVYVDDEDRITDVSVKRHISEQPENDHAIVATFWFQNGEMFIHAAEKMISEGDRVNGEYYVDQVIQHVLDLGYCARVFEVDRFLNYGTPEDYETYGKMIEHFKTFIQSKVFL